MSFSFKKEDGSGGQNLTNPKADSRVRAGLFLLTLGQIDNGTTVEGEEEPQVHIRSSHSLLHRHFSRSRGRGRRG